MNWKSITSNLGSTLQTVKHAAEAAAKAVEHEAAKVGAKAAEFLPLQAALPQLADKIDSFFEAHAGHDFPRELSVPTPTAHAALSATPVSVVPKDGLALTGANPTASFGVHLDQTGEAQLDLTAAGPGTDWGKKGAESAVMSVYVDGKYQQDLVLWGGAKAQGYGVALGELPKGDHTVTLLYADGKSTGGAKGVSVSAGTASVVSYASKEDGWAAQNAPVLVGRHGGLENNHNDTPLGMFHRISKGKDGSTTISYGYAFSNEDTGDGAQPALEQARWGRLTDLETVFKVTVDANGQVLSRQYEGAGHHWHPFAGKFDGSHAVIRTATDNNNVTDQGDGPLRFRFPTDNRVGDFPSEDLMRRHPEWFAAEGKELLREGKIDPNGVGDAPLTGKAKQVQTNLAALGILPKAQMADPRNYLYVQLDAKGADQDPLVARVTLKNGETFDSNLGVAEAAINRNGWSQTSVRLPPGTTKEDIAQVSFVSNGTAQVNRVGNVYLLDGEYKPVALPASAVQR
jgi:hypothetical protein